MDIPRYPRTLHLDGSGIGSGSRTPWDELKGRQVIIEEKVDGSVLAAMFDEGRLRLAHRNSFVEEEREFITAKKWFGSFTDALYGKLGERFVLYGEWMEFKHTVFYDLLPHFFLEYDLYDRHASEFLSTERRRELIGDLPIVPVGVLYGGEGCDKRMLLGPSLYKSPRWREALQRRAGHAGVSKEQAEQETLLDDLAEGLYVKVEEEGLVTARYKFVRREFVQAIVDSEHWARRRRFRNALTPKTSLWP